MSDVWIKNTGEVPEGTTKNPVFNLKFRDGATAAKVDWYQNKIWWKILDDPADILEYQIVSE